MTTETYAISGGKPTIIKDPQEVLDYSLDWTQYLAPIADTITAFVATVTGAALNLSVTTGNVTTAWVSGGTAGSTASVNFHITTAGGRTVERTIYLKIKDR